MSTGGSKTPSPKVETRVAAATSDAPSIHIDGETVFTSGSVDIPRYGPYAKAFAEDMDGDGDLDIVVNDGSNADKLDWYANDGQGNISGTANTTPLSQYGLDVALADVNGDGIKDLIVVSNGDGVADPELQGRVDWFAGNGDGTFASEGQQVTGGILNAYDTAAIDFDNDGDIDILTVGANEPGGVVLSTNDGAGNFTDTKLATGAVNPLSIKVVDINGDGRLDIVTGGAATMGSGGFGADSAAVVSINNGDGTFTQQTLTVATGNPGVWDVETADFDGDGNLDILATDPNSASVTLFTNNGDGTFGEAVAVGGQQWNGRVDSAVGDVDGDGDIDIVTTESDGVDWPMKISWFENDGNGNFTEHRTGAVAEAEATVALADIDGNGVLDIIRGGRTGTVTERAADVEFGFKSLKVTENTASSLSGISFSDDTTGATVTVTLTVPAGTLSAASASGVDVAGDGTDTLTLTGSITDINAYMAAGNATYLTATDSEADVKLTISINDGTASLTNEASTTMILDVEPYAGQPPQNLVLTGSDIAENAATGTVIGTLSATDPDGGTLTYTLSDDAGGKFAISVDAGGVASLVVNGALDHETAGSHQVTVTATDTDGNSISEDFTVSVADVDEAPTEPELSNSTVSEDAAVGTVVGTLSATDPENAGAITYALVDDANGLFELVGNEIRLKAALDYETATSHDITVKATDATGQETTSTLTLDVGNVMESGEQPPMITITATGATAGMDFEAYIRGGFTTGTTGGGFPAFDNGSAFEGEEMFLGYGSNPDSKYVLMHGDLEYYFGTHTVAGTGNTIEYGTRGSGTYDANGYFTGGNVELRITGLDLYNAIPTNSAEEQAIEANGSIHNFALAHMYGAPTSSTQSRYDKYADALDEYAQSFSGSGFGDTFTGTRFNDNLNGNGGADTLSGGAGDDLLAGGAGNDVLDGGDGEDTAIYTLGNRADYTITENSDGSWTVQDNRSVFYATGTDTLTNIENLRFMDQTVDLDAPVENSAPTDLELSANTVAENAATGTVIGELSAEDADGDTLTYELTNDAGGKFALQTVNGVTSLIVNGALDYETATTHQITVKVTDGKGAELTETLTVDVTDIVDTPALGTITIDASVGTEGMDFNAFITDYIGGKTGGSYKFYGGTPDSIFGQTQYVNGDQVAYNYSGSDARVVMQGNDMAYDWIHYGQSYPHALSGEMNELIFGDWVDGQTTATEGTGEAGMIQGLNERLVISGFEIDVAPGTGNTADNYIMKLYNMFLAADAAGTYDFLGLYAQNFIGSDGDDSYGGTRFDDTVDGGEGNDTAVFTGNRSDYTLTENSDGSWTVEDNRAGETNDGTDTLTNVENAQFADETVALEGAENTAPLAGNDSASLVKDLSKVIDVLANDADADGSLDPASVTIVTGPAHGTVTINTTTGAITYKPATGYVGADTFTYTVKDNDGSVSNTATVTLDVTGAHILTSGDDVFSGDTLGLSTGIEVHGGAGDDYIVTSNRFAQADTIDGGDGNDLIFTGGGNDYVEGGDGDDVIHARAGNDTVIGGEGDDTFVVRFTDIGTTTITDDDGTLWHGTFRPATYPASWNPAPGATSGYGIAGDATQVSEGVWNLAVTDNTGATVTLTLNWTGGDLSIVRDGSPQTIVIKDYVSGTFGITLEGVEEENTPPTAPVLSADTVEENSAVGTVVGTLSSTDADNDPLTYTLTNDAGGKFALVTENGVTKLVVNGPLDYETGALHSVTIKVSDGKGGETSQSFDIDVTDVDETDPTAPGTIVLDASDATAGMDLEAFLRGGFLAGTTGGGMPVFDNGTGFSGEEMFIGYGTGATDKYISAHGNLEYYFNTHTVWGEIGTIEYGTRGSGSFDSNGYFTGGNVELRITGLDLANARPNNATEEADIEANGSVHNFATGHMYGANGSQTKLDQYADDLDDYAQHFKGSAFADIYVGTKFADTIESGAGNDLLAGGGGNDTIDGGAGSDTVYFDGVFGQGGTYSFTGGTGGAPLVITDSRATGGTGVDTLTNVEFLRFNNLTYDFVNHRANYTPTDVALDDAEVDGDAAVGTVVGSLSVTDQDTSDTHTLTLIDNAGGKFTIDGTDIKVAGALTEDSYTVRVRVTDGAGNTFEKDFTIDVADPAEPPVNTAPVITSNGGGDTAAINVAENGTAVTTVVATDADAGATRTYSIAGGADASLFQIDAATGALSFKAAPDFENPLDVGRNNVYDVIVRATDNGGLFDEQALAVTVTDVLNENLAPTDLKLSKSSVEENVALGTVVGMLSATDPEGQPLTYTLVNDAGGKFQITRENGQVMLVVAGGLDYETATRHQITVRVSDGLLNLEQTFTISVLDIANEGTIEGTAGDDTLQGSDGDDRILGGEGNDQLVGGAGNDTLNGGAGDDKLYAGEGDDVVYSGEGDDEAYGGEGNDELFGAAGNDVLGGGEGNDKVYGGDGDDIVYSGAGADETYGGEGDDVLYGGAGDDFVGGAGGNDEINGGAGSDEIYGGDGDDRLSGGTGNDALFGGNGDDRLVGGTGADQLHGGAGSDVFVFKDLTDSTVGMAGRDTIFDFNGAAGDRIDLSGLDANSDLAGRQTFSFVGADAFSGKAGELRFDKTAADTFIYGDVDGDGKADFAIHLATSTTLVKDFFLL